MVAPGCPPRILPRGRHRYPLRTLPCSRIFPPCSLPPWRFAGQLRCRRSGRCSPRPGRMHACTAHQRRPPPRPCAATLLVALRVLIAYGLRVISPRGTQHVAGRLGPVCQRACRLLACFRARGGVPACTLHVAGRLNRRVNEPRLACTPGSFGRPVGPFGLVGDCWVSWWDWP